MQDAVVIGGGISGLSVAWELTQRLPNGRLTLLEVASRVGGNIRTERRDGYLCEWGPTGFLNDAPATLEACRKLGLGPRLTEANDAAARRFIVRGGKLRELPTGPLSFLTSDVLTLPGRLRVLAEPLVRPRKSDRDESVSAFATRRVGAEAARVLVDALITGIWAGDAETLSIRSALPKLAALERDHGGLVRGMIAKRGAGGGAMGPRGRLTSFPDGLAELPAALASHLGDRIRLNTRVATIERSGDAGYRVRTDRGETVEGAAVVLACPAWFAAPVVAGLDAELSESLGSIPTVAVAVVHLGFATQEAAGLQGFGFLIPRGEHDSVLGVLLPSNIFPRRAPDDRVLATVMIGGARSPSALERSDEELIDSARSAVSSLAGARATPRFAYVVRHPRAIPQYTLGHADRLKAIAARLSRLPGLFLAGNSYNGIAINACLAEAPSVAEALSTGLRR